MIIIYLLVLCIKTIWRKYIWVNLGPHSPHHYKSILLPKCKDTFASKISFVDHIWPAAASIGNVIVCCCCLQLSGFDLVSQRVQAGHLYIKEKAKVKAITVLRPHIQISCVWESLTKTKNTFVLKSSCTFVSLIFQIISDKFYIND